MTHLRVEKEGKERLHGWEQKFPMNTNSEGTTSSFSKTSRTVVSFPIAFSNKRNVKVTVTYINPCRTNYIKFKKNGMTINSSKKLGELLLSSLAFWLVYFVSLVEPFCNLFFSFSF